MDAELGPWTRRGLGFGLGLLVVVALGLVMIGPDELKRWLRRTS